MLSAAFNHTKMRRLQRLLGIPQYAAVGILESLWNLARMEYRAGDIGVLSDEDIAFGIGWESDPKMLIDGLLKAGWLDPSETHRLIIHDWSTHVDDTVDVFLARNGIYYADGKIPRMRRLPQTERAKLLETKFSKRGKVVRTKGAQKRTGGAQGAQEMPFPCEPEPLPEPEPEPVQKTHPPPPQIRKSAAEPSSPEPAPSGVRVMPSPRHRLTEADRNLVDLVLLGSPPGIVAGLTVGAISPAQRVPVIEAAKREAQEHGISVGEAIEGLRVAVEHQANALPHDRLNLLGGFGKYFTEAKYRIDPVHIQQRNGGHNGESKHMASIRQAAVNLGLGPTGARQDEPAPRRQRLT